MINKSIWSSTKINKTFPKLNSNLKIDILIIGGGITGINILYKLKDKDVCLVERNKIGSGVTLNTTGKITYLQDIYDKIIKNHSEQVASLYLKSQIDSINEIKKIITENNINCDFKPSESHLFVNQKKNIKKLKKVKDLLTKNNIKVTENNLPLINSKYSISVNNTYLFNPIKYIEGLCNLINPNKIYENTNIIDIKYENKKYICKTKEHKIIANKIILSNHYPNFIYPYFFPLKAYLEKSYIVSYKKKIDNISLISIDKPVISIRNYKNNFIFLGRFHNICNKTNDNNNFHKLFNKIDEKPEYIWSNIDIITNDYLPYIGYIKDNMIIATGYNTWGMTNSVLSGMIVKDIIEKNSNKYIKLVNPKRVKNKKRIIKDALCSIKGYYEGFTNENSKIKYTKKDGIDVMIYKERNKEYIVKRKCPHAKCNLIFNEVEKTFDCPCHSSRFDLEGNVIKGPSKYNIKMNK